MIIKKKSEAVSDVVGTILMLLLTIMMFTLAYVTVLSPTSLSSSPSPYVKIIGKIEGNNIILDHRGGEALGLDTAFFVTIGDSTQNFIVSDYLNNESKANERWNVGERVVYPAENISGLRIVITVIDVESDSIVMKGVLRDDDG